MPDLGFVFGCSFLTALFFSTLAVFGLATGLAFSVTVYPQIILPLLKGGRYLRSRIIYCLGCLSESLFFIQSK